MPDAGLVVYLVVLALQRALELRHSSHNARRLAAAGAVEHGAAHFPWIVLVHALFPLCLTFEVVRLGARPGPAWPAWLALWIAAQALRYWSVAALGGRWTARVWVLPGAPLARRGPYRWLAHPNYLAVVVEFIAAPMMFGAWRTAALISVLDALVLSIRMRAEERALASTRDAVPGPDAR